MHMRLLPIIFRLLFRRLAVYGCGRHSYPFKLYRAPAVNTAFLALGAVCANIMGTTGAAMLLIRPLIAANAHRRYDMHTFVFFIFIVANIAGSLTPLGDPPLFLGFLRGVEFFWTTEHLIVPMATAVGLLLLIYFITDTILFNKEKEEFLEKESHYPKEPFGIDGKINFLLLAVIVSAVLMAGIWHSGIEFSVLGVHLSGEGVLRDVIFLIAAGLSLKLTSKEVREANQFGWDPILEVGKLFFGIFVTIVPVLEMLRAGLTVLLPRLLRLLPTRRQRQQRHVLLDDRCAFQLPRQRSYLSCIL